MADTSNSAPVESMSVGRIFKNLTAGQVWGLTGTVLGILSAAFGLGYQASHYLSEVQSGRNSSLEQQHLDLATRERFFALYVRYLLAKSAAEKDGTEENKKTLAANKTGFRDFIQDLVKRNESARNGIDTRGLFLVKGATDDASVRFADGSLWPVPREIGLAAAGQ